MDGHGKMRIAVLASGSKGNCTYVESNNHHMLIDIGTTNLSTERKLKDLCIDPKSIDSIFITHSHIDHIAGVRVFIKKYKPTIYLTQKMYKEVRDLLEGTTVVFIEEDFYLDSLHVETFKTSHDTEDSVGYIFTEEGKSLVYVTDTGYINLKNKDKLENKSLYIIESNHDVEMLLNGKYPFSIKQRIIGDRGHLSNADSAYYMSQFIGEQTNKVILAHLSHDNNTEQVALATYQQVFEKHHIEFDDIIIARQEERTDLIEV